MLSGTLTTTFFFYIVHAFVTVLDIMSCKTYEGCVKCGFCGNSKFHIEISKLNIFLKEIPAPLYSIFIHVHRTVVLFFVVQCKY